MPDKTEMSGFLRLRLRPWGLLGAFGFLAALTTLAGFFGAYAWWLDILSHFRVQYALFFLLWAASFALGRKKQAGAASLAMAFVNALPVILFLLPPARTEPESGPHFRTMLMNVNTQHGDPARVIAAITNENPDFLVLEEISDEWVGRLAPALQAYPFQKVETRNDNFGIGLFSRIPLETARVEYFGMVEVPSIFAEITLEDRKLTLIATHPLPPGGAEYAACRNEQLDQIARKAASIQGPVLLLGDLNVSPWSTYYRRFVKTSGLKDSARGRSIQPTWPSISPFLWVQIDHCFYSDELAILARRIGPNDGSDHYPVIVDAAWKSAQTEPIR